MDVDHINDANKDDMESNLIVQDSQSDSLSKFGITGVPASGSDVLTRGFDRGDAPRPEAEPMETW